MAARLLWATIGRSEWKATSEDRKVPVLYPDLGHTVDEGEAVITLSLGILTMDDWHNFLINISAPSGSPVHTDTFSFETPTEEYRFGWKIMPIAYDLPVFPVDEPGIYTVNVLLDGEVPLVSLGLPITPQGDTP